MKDPSASVPALARGLAATRKAIAQFAGEPDAVFILDVKERQFVDAINTALGIELQATAQAPGSPEGSAMGPAVPGQKIEVRAALSNRGTVDIDPTEIALINGDAWGAQAATPVPSLLTLNQTARRTFSATVPERAPLARPYFERASIAEARYAIRDAAQSYRPAAEAVLTARARYLVAGVPVSIRVDRAAARGPPPVRRGAPRADGRPRRRRERGSARGHRSDRFALQADAARTGQSRFASSSRTMRNRGRVDC